jgi:hypothetical protein
VLPGRSSAVRSKFGLCGASSNLLCVTHLVCAYDKGGLAFEEPTIICCAFRVWFVWRSSRLLCVTLLVHTLKRGLLSRN